MVARVACDAPLSASNDTCDCSPGHSGGGSVSFHSGLGRPKHGSTLGQLRPVPLGSQCCYRTHRDEGRADSPSVDSRQDSIRLLRVASHCNQTPVSRSSYSVNPSCQKQVPRPNFSETRAVVMDCKSFLNSLPDFVETPKAVSTSRLCNGPSAQTRRSFLSRVPADLAAGEEGQSEER